MYNSPSAVDLSKPITLRKLKNMRDQGEKITMLTCYDASFAALMDAAGVDCLLVGDSLGMVIQGNDDTLPVTIEDMIYHTRIVANIVKRAWVIADMPFGSYTSKVDAFENAKKLMQAGAKMVKMEGGEWLLPIVKFLTERGIPVCAHLGLTPQSVHQIGGYRIQAKDADGQAQLLKDAKDLEAAGATMLVLELMPSVPAQQVTDALQIPTIGIGAGSDTSGQVLVIYDIINLYPGKKARFVKNYLAGKDNIFDAIADYVSEVKSGAFPAAEHSYE